MKKSWMLLVVVILLCGITNAYAYILPDTGQTTCYSATGVVISCTGTGQDGEFSINPMSFTDNGNGTVTDNNTGLIWQKCSAGQNNDSTCTGTATQYTWANAGTYCSNLNSPGLGGYTDWRLPTKKELVGIVDFSVGSGARINLTNFPSTQANSYWTGTDVANTSGADAWDVYFDYGMANGRSKSYSNYVRCVRGTGVSANLTDNGNNTITDSTSGLMWQKCSAGQTTDSTCSGTATTATWQGALDYCNSLTLASYSDWRLPNAKEIESITDDSTYLPAINAPYFPATSSSSYWSSTSDANQPSGKEDYAFSAQFNYGTLISDPVGASVGKKTDGYYVRCVRVASTYTLTVTKTGTGTGTVSSTPAGINCGATCSASFSSGAAVSLIATPDVGSSFVSWSGSCSGTNPTTSVTIDAAKTCTATFNTTPTTYTLTVTKAGSGTGAVTAWANCTLTWSGAGNNTGTCTVNSGTSITLSGSADAGSTFTGWSSGTNSASSCTGTGSCTFNLTANSAVTATFNTVYTLTVTKAGSGAGTVTSAPTGINCGANCSASFGSGAAVTLTATPDVGSSFAGWSGDADCSDGSVTMDAAKSCTATFNSGATTYTFIVTKAGSGGGNITVTGCTPSWNGNTGTCTVNSGTSLTISGSAGLGSMFVGFTGAGCVGTSDCQITVSANKYMTATFQTTNAGNLTVLPQTGQTTSYDTNTIKLDDGALRTGSFLVSSRFATGSPTDTVIDKQTGLMWMAAGNTPTVGSCTGGVMNWTAGLDYIICLNNSNYLGFSDWRMPNVNEMASLFNSGQTNTATWLNTQGFTGMPTSSAWYWTSTTNNAASNNAFALATDNGTFVSTNKTTDTNYVLAVRNSSYTPVSTTVARTGQNTSYDATRYGEDGDIQAGAAMPSPRFTTNADTTIKDNLTNLVWSPSANNPTVGACTGGAMNWQNTVNYINCLNSNSYLNYSDWRMPNKNELRSLMDYQNSAPALPTGHPFTNVQNSTYWSSTTVSSSTTSAYTVNFNSGVLSNVTKTTSTPYVIPVRGGNVSVVVTKSGSGTVRDSTSSIDCGSQCTATYGYNGNNFINISFIPDAGKTLTSVTVNGMNIGVVYRLKIRSMTNYVDIQAVFSN